MATFNQIKARNGKYNGRIQLQYLMTEYLVKKEKIINKVFSGINCNDNPLIAYEEMSFFKNNNSNKKGSREYFHFVHSFSPEESKILTPNQANEITKALIKSLPEFDKCQVSIITHEDKKHLHSHIIVNSVIPNEKKKLRINDIELFNYKARKHSDIICSELGLSICQNNKNNIDDILNNKIKNAGNRKTIEARKNNDLEKDKVAKDVLEICSKTKNKYMFIKELLNKGYIIDWKENKKRVSKKTGKEYISPPKIKIRNKSNKKFIHLEKIFSEYHIDYQTIKNIDIKKHFELIENNKIERLKDDSEYRAILEVKNLTKILKKLSNENYYENNNILNTKVGLNDIFANNHKTDKERGDIY